MLKKRKQLEKASSTFKNVLLRVWETILDVSVEQPYAAFLNGGVVVHDYS